MKFIKCFCAFLSLMLSFNVNAEEIEAFIYKGIGGYEVKDLTTHAKFPDGYDEKVSLNELDYSAVGDKYGTFARGYFVPSESGSYKFHITGDDSTSLLVKTENKLITAYFRGWAPRGNWSKYSTQESEAVDLVEGVPYYFELFQKEHFGGDHFQIAWSKNGGAIEIVKSDELKRLDFDFGIKTYGRKYYVAGKNVEFDLELGDEVGAIKVELINGGNILKTEILNETLKADLSFKVPSGVKGSIFLKASSVLDPTLVKLIELSEAKEAISEYEKKYYYSLDELNDGVVVDDNNYLHGLEVGDTVCLANGKKGNCYEFNGSSDYLRFYPVKTFPVNNVGTVSLWIKTKFGNRGLIYHGDIGRGSGWSLYINRSGRITIVSQLGEIVGKSDLRSDSWKNVTVTFENKKVKVYIDSNLEIDHEYIEPLISKNYRNFFLGIGYRKARFKGQMDEVRYYNSALSKSQIEFQMMDLKELEFDKTKTTQVIKSNGVANLVWKNQTKSSNTMIQIKDVVGRDFYTENVSGNTNSHKFSVDVPEGIPNLIAYIKDGFGNQDSIKLDIISESSLDALNDVLVSHYPLDEQFGDIAEDEASSQIATIFDVDLGGEGAIGSAFKFNFSSRLVFKRQPDLYGAKARTISLWLKSKPRWNKQLILRNGQNVKNGLFLIGTDELGRVVCDLGGGQVVTSKSSVRNDLWNHVVISYENKKVKIFINGTQESSYILNDELNTRTTEFYLGGRFGSYYEFTGSVDDFRTYKTSMDEGNVKIIGLPRQEVSMSIAYLQNATLLPKTVQKYRFRAWSKSHDIVGVSLLDNGNLVERIGSSSGEIDWKSESQGVHDLVFYAHLINGEDIKCRSAKITITASSFTEGFLYERWNGVNGSKVSDLTKYSKYPSYPDIQKIIPNVTSENSKGSNFGARYRGTYEIKANGWYQFAISGDDQVKLFHNKGEISFGKSKLAEAYRIPGSKTVEDFSRAQFSRKIYFRDGEKVFIEIIQKESWGADFVKLYVNNFGEDNGSASIGFELIENVKPFDLNKLDFNVLSLADHAVIEAGDSITFYVEVLDYQGNFSDVRVLINNDEVDSTTNSKSTFTVSSLSLGDNEITIQAVNAEGHISQKSYSIKVVEALSEFMAGIRYDLWNNVLTANYVDKEGNRVFDTKNTGFRYFDVFKIPESENPDRGLAVGYIVPEKSGTYHFSIAGGGRSQLFLKIDDGEEMMIAQVQGSAEDNWTETQEQISAGIELEHGKKYSFRVDHSSYFGKGGFAIAWNYFNGEFLSDEKFVAIEGKFLEIIENQLNSDLVLSSDNIEVLPELVFPKQGEKISESYVDFGWTSTSAIQEYLLYVGYKKGNSTFFKKEQIPPGINFIENVGWLPLGNEPIFVKFGYKMNDRWYFKYYEYETVSSGLVKKNESKDVNENGIGDKVDEQIGQWIDLENISYLSEKTIYGKDALDYSEGWKVSDESIYNYKGRGELNFDLMVDQPSIQLMSVEFKNQLGHEASNAYDLLFYIDGNPIEQWNLKPKGETEFVDILLPVLSSGNHKLTFFWNSFATDPYFSFERIKLKGLSINDEQKQAILGESEKTFNKNIKSEVSPCFIEGISKFKKYVQVSSSFQQDIAVKDSINDRWWADVPLVEGMNQIDVKYQNGAYVEKVNIEWVAIDFSTQNNRRFRQGAKVLLSLGNSSYGSITIGESQYVLGRDQVVEHEFIESGKQVVVAQFFDDNNTSYTIHSTVDVVLKLNDQKYYVVENSYRDINLGYGADLVLDSGKLTLETIEEYKKYSIVLNDAFKNQTFVTRLSQNGPIVNSFLVEGVYYTNTTVRNGSSEVIQILDDETWIAKETSFTYKFPEDLRLDVNIFVNGVIFDDGTRFKSMTSKDFTSFGVHDMIILRPKFAHQTTCHQVMIYQGNTRVYRR